MSITRAFTTRRVRATLDAANNKDVAPQRSNTTKGSLSLGPGALRHKISAPLELIHTTNMLTYNAPDLFPQQPVSDMSAPKRTVSSSSGESTGRKSLSGADSDTDSAGTAASTPPTSPDVSPAEDRPMSPEPNHLSCYFMPPGQSAEKGGATTAAAAAAADPAAPVIPQRAPSHTTKRSYEFLARQRSHSRLSGQSTTSTLTKASSSSNLFARASLASSTASSSTANTTPHTSVSSAHSAHSAKPSSSSLFGSFHNHHHHHPAAHHSAASPPSQHHHQAIPESPEPPAPRSVEELQRRLREQEKYKSVPLPPTPAQDKKYRREPLPPTPAPPAIPQRQQSERRAQPPAPPPVLHHHRPTASASSTVAYLSAQRELMSPRTQKAQHLHPFGLELAQVTEIAEEYGVREKVALQDEEERQLAAQGLFKFAAEDYMCEIQGLFASIIGEVRPVAAVWI